MSDMSIFFFADQVEEDLYPIWYHTMDAEDIRGLNKWKNPREMTEQEIIDAQSEELIAYLNYLIERRNNDMVKPYIFYLEDAVDTVSDTIEDLEHHVGYLSSCMEEAIRQGRHSAAHLFGDSISNLRKVIYNLRNVENVEEYGGFYEYGDEDEFPF